MAADGDERAPGAAITVELCGHWQHEPPCPLAAHHTHATRHGDELYLRILFATEPETETVVRRRIGRTLAHGRFLGPGGVPARWQLSSARPSRIRGSEEDHAKALALDPPTS